MDIKSQLIEGCRQIGIELREDAAEKLLNYKNILLEWNKVMNLTAVTEDSEVITKHFIDSLIILKYFDISNKKIIDVGTGAGFPGLPLKIAKPSSEFTLMDSLNKRTKFLEESVNKLDINNINIIWGRAEEFGVKNEHREKYDYAVSRAVANLRTLSEYCIPFVKMGGYFISLKGPDVEDELDDAKNAVIKLGGEVEKIEKYKLPFTDIIHSIIFIKKIKQTPSIYPRKAGKPSKEPIK